MKFKMTSTIIVIASQILTGCVGPSNRKQSVNANNPPIFTEQMRTPSSTLAETPWTTWSEKSTIGGLKVLKHIRESLLQNNLHDPHVHYGGYEQVECTPDRIRFRTADGTCNDPSHALVGSAGVAFGRNIAPEFIDKDAAEKLMIPNPAVVSKVFFTRDQFKPVPFLNMLAASWIQFMNHDWLTHGRNMEQSPHRVESENGTRIVERTKENPTNPNQYKGEYGKVSLNEVTHWWDGSQIYGSSQQQQNQVRSFSRGKMRTQVVNGRELLPRDPNLNTQDNKQNQGYEITGFRDNWWVGLSILHTLFVKEHNTVADMLMKKHVRYNPQTKLFTWKNRGEVKTMDEKKLDEQIFQTSRLIVSAIMAKIHTVEWTPAILANETLRIGMYGNWYGTANPQTWSKIIKHLPGMNRTDWNEKVQSGYVVGGIVGDKTNNYGTPYSITEEFTSVYRLHSLLPEKLNIRKMAEKSNVQQVPFADTRNDKSYAYMANYDLKDLYYSFGTQNPGQLVLNNFPKFMQELTIPGHPQMDLGMVDIMRDRERGVPRYNQFRRAIGLKELKSYKDFFPATKPLDERQQQILAKFYEVYGRDADGKDNIEMVDLLVGTLAEEVRPKDFGFGETLFQIFILMASRRLMADRFFTENYRAKYYTESGINWIDDEGTLSQVIVRHMPELKPKLRGIKTAFNPWNQ